VTSLYGRHLALNLPYRESTELIKENHFKQTTKQVKQVRNTRYVITEYNHKLPAISQDVQLSAGFAASHCEICTKLANLVQTKWKKPLTRWLSQSWPNTRSFPTVHLCCTPWYQWSKLVSVQCKSQSILKPSWLGWGRFQYRNGPETQRRTTVRHISGRAGLRKRMEACLGPNAPYPLFVCFVSCLSFHWRRIFQLIQDENDINYSRLEIFFGWTLEKKTCHTVTKMAIFIFLPYIFVQNFLLQYSWATLWVLMVIKSPKEEEVNKSRKYSSGCGESTERNAWYTKQLCKSTL